MIETLGNMPASSPVFQWEFVTGLISDDPTEATHNVTALQSAIDKCNEDMVGASLPNRGCRLLIPAGNYYINDTVYIRDAFGFVLSGDGFQTNLLWNGDDETKSAIVLSHARQCTLKDFIINMTTDAYAAIQCRRDNHEGFVNSPSMNRFKNIFIDGQGKHRYGIAFGGEGSIDANNDFNYLETVSSSHYSDAGFLLWGSQSYNNEFVNCRAASYYNGDYGVYTGEVGGSFHWRGGFVGGNEIADFAIGRSNQPYHIEGFNSEGSQHVLEIIPEFFTHVKLNNFRWAGNAKPEGGAIILQSQTADTQLQLEISNGRMGTGLGGNPADFTLPIKFNDYSSFRLDQSVVCSSASNVFPTDTPSSGAGNVQILNEGTMQRQMLTW